MAASGSTTTATSHTASPAALVQQLYIAYYGRPGDPAGLAYWIDYFSTTDNLDQALAAFGTSAEFTDRYGGLSTTALVHGLYRQMLNREAEADGLAFYSERLDSGDATLASIALDIANGAQNSDRTILDNKIAVAMAYTEAIAASGAAYGAPEIETAQALLAAVDATLDSVAAGIGRPVVLLEDRFEELLVNSVTQNFQASPSVTGLSDGGWVVTWESYGQDGSGYGVFGQAYHGDGTRQGGEFQVNSFMRGAQLEPSVTSLSDGGWVVTWMSYGQDGSGYGVFGQAYHGDGTRQGGEFQVNSFTQDHQYSPSLTGLSDGGWVVTWNSEDQDGSEHDVYAQAYHADGARQGGEFQVNSFTRSFQYSPSVTGLSDGGWVVTWQSFGQDSSCADVYGQAYHADGTRQGGEFQVNSFTRDCQGSTSVTVLSDGGWVVTWQSEGHQDGSEYGVYAQAYHADGAPQGGEFQVSNLTQISYRLNLQYSPSVTGLSDGGWVVTWNSEDQDGSEHDVYAQAYHADGARQGGEFQVNSFTPGYQYSPSVTGLSDGGWVVTWQSESQDGSGDIYSKTYHADGTVRPSGDPVTVTYREGGAAVSIYAGVTLANTEGSDLVSAVIRPSDFVAGDRLTVDRGLPAGISATYHNDTGAVTLTGAASLADYEAALKHIVYSSSADLSGTTARTIALVVYNGADSNGRTPGGTVIAEYASDPVTTTITVVGAGTTATVVGADTEGVFGQAYPITPMVPVRPDGDPVTAAYREGDAAVSISAGIAPANTEGSDLVSAITLADPTGGNARYFVQDADADPYLDSDAVFALKDELIVRFEESADTELTDEFGLPAEYWTPNFDFVLPLE